MLQVPAPNGCLLFTSFLYRSDLISDKSLQELWFSQYGSFFSLTPAFNPLAEYYSKEMGHTESLKRFFLISTQIFPRDILLDSKLKALEWERNFSQDQKRLVNIDTGAISLENFLLATTKNYSHRIFIGQGLFADLTYEFKQGSYKELPWTYPDYLDPEKNQFITWARSYLQTNLFNQKTHC